MFKWLKRYALAPTPTMSDRYPILYREILELNLGVAGNTTIIRTVQILVDEIHRLQSELNGPTR